MKAFVIALLFATTSAAEPVWSLRSVQDHRTDSDVQKAYGDHSTVSANGRPPYQSEVQMESDSESDSESDDENVQLKGDYYTVADDGKAMNGAYERVTTARFAGDSDDIFMRSMIQQYALEAKNCDEDGANCVPSGNFWMSESATRAAAGEVLATHKGLGGEALSSYLDTYFTKAWGHFDVNRVGYIEVIKSPQLMRFLCSDQYMSLGESG